MLNCKGMEEQYISHKYIYPTEDVKSKELFIYVGIAVATTPLSVFI